MTARRIEPVIVMIGLFLVGLVCGCLYGASRRSYELWEIWPEFRHEEVDQMFADYKAGRIAYTVSLPVLAGRLKVAVVNNRTRGADFGFVPLGEMSDVPTHLWYFKSGAFELKKYDYNTICVIIKDRYASELKRHPDESQYSERPCEGKQ